MCFIFLYVFFTASFFIKQFAYSVYFIEGIKVLDDMISATLSAWAQRVACIELMSTIRELSFCTSRNIAFEIWPFRNSFNRR